MTVPSRSSLFDGRSLAGWHSIARLPSAPWPGASEPDPSSEAYVNAERWPARWSVVDGVIEGQQEPPGSGYGGYLITDETYGDFELEFDANPDWPADTGVMLRATPRGSQGFQVLLDHRRSGGIGSFYGNGIGGFRAIPYKFDAKVDDLGNPIGLVADHPATTVQPLADSARTTLDFAVSIEDFLANWKWAEWNTFKVRCVGESPTLTTWINDLKVAELDTSAINAPNYDAKRVAALLGRQGHIALEVHNNDPTLGKERWWPGAKCLWRNLLVTVLDG